ncbi:UNVERIFIED_CONTAM: hypothetical protein PYX00_000366 [Menopon gallinae]|uniref:Uncharacterized protein n=1 Tax=Menopon gallinae TaxID=328185 RepID=A0AAW2I9P1_9NEOP
MQSCPFVNSVREKYRRFYCRVCTAGGFGHAWFVLILGIVGALVTICDIIQITEGGSMLTENLWRNRINRGTQRLVRPETERDLKLMVSILSMEHYILMVFGVSQKNPALLLPWMMMEATVIALEAILFGMRLFVEGFAMSRGEVFMSAIVIHNWFQVFCFFRKNLTMCDL